MANIILAEATMPTLSGLLTDVTSVFTTVIGKIIDVATAALQSPVVVLFIGMAVTGCIVGFAKKLLHV